MTLRAGLWRRRTRWAWPRIRPIAFTETGTWHHGLKPTLRHRFARDRGLVLQPAFSIGDALAIARSYVSVGLTARYVGRMLLLLLAMACAEPSPLHDGRPIAPVMSWQGADWLERADREREEATRRMLKQLGLKPGDRVVDLGCGSGFHARRIKGMVGEQGVVHCVDLQPEMLELAAILAADQGVTLSFVQGEEGRIPLPDASVDHLLMVDVYHELQDPAAMLAEMKRVLAPQGVVHFVEFRLEGSSAQHIKSEHRMALGQLRAELARAGLHVVATYDKLPSQHLVSARAAE